MVGGGFASVAVKLHLAGSDGKMALEVGDEPVEGGDGIGRAAVDLDAVAGGKDDGFFDSVDRADLAEVVRHAVLGYGETLPDLNRGGLVIDAETENGHRIGRKLRVCQDQSAERVARAKAKAPMEESERRLGGSRLHACTARRRA